MSIISKFRIERLLDIRKTKTNIYELKVKWADYKTDQSTWEPSESIESGDLEELLNDLMEYKKNKRRLITDLLTAIEIKQEKNIDEDFEEITVSSDNNIIKAKVDIETELEQYERSLSHRSTKPSIKSANLAKHQITTSKNKEISQKSYLDTPDLYMNQRQPCEPKFYRNMLIQMFDRDTDLRSYTAFSYAFVKDLLVSPMVTKISADIDMAFLNVNTDTEIKGLYTIKGLQRIYNPNIVNIGYRVTIIKNDNMVIRTIDTVYIEQPKAAFTHLKKKLCQLYLMRNAYFGYLGSISDLIK